MEIINQENSLPGNPSGADSSNCLAKVLFKPHAYHLKTALLNYFRFKRQFVAGDEVKSGVDSETCDILVLDKEGYAIDIEVKLSKSDLWVGEKRKCKHTVYRSSMNGGPTNNPNYFYICVPTELIEEAKKWVKETNARYGIIEFCTASYPPYGRGWENLTSIKKQAKILHDKVNVKWSRVLLKRLSSTVCTLYQKRIETNEAKH